MLNSNAIRGLCALMICCAAALASERPQVTLRIGAELIGPNHYLVHEKTMVTVKVDANEGDLIAVFAMALDEFGRPDKSAVLLLLLVESKDGGARGDFWIPGGLGGQSFAVAAIAISDAQTMAESEVARVDVSSSDPPANDPIEPADPEKTKANARSDLLETLPATNDE
jgi:hypothetical protein